MGRGRGCGRVFNPSPAKAYVLSSYSYQVRGIRVRGSVSVRIKLLPWKGVMWLSHVTLGLCGVDVHVDVIIEVRRHPVENRYGSWELQSSEKHIQRNSHGWYIISY